MVLLVTLEDSGKKTGYELSLAHDLNIVIGDGVNVITAGSVTVRTPRALNIIAARIRSMDSSGALVSGSITCTLYKHDIDAAKGDAVDTFAISSDTDYTEADLDIDVESGKWLTVVVSDITAVKQITLALEYEG